jgi:hypothetical protein
VVGDTVRVEIEGIGGLENTVMAGESLPPMVTKTVTESPDQTP